MKSLHKTEVWEKVKKESHSQPVVVFKHSNTCPVSESAHARVKELEKGNALDGDMYIVIVQNAGDISDLIEEETGIKHESPQVIVMSGGEAVYHESHDKINAQEIAKQLVMAKEE